MDRSNKVPTQSDADGRRRREVRESKPAREWTIDERREAFIETPRLERQKSEAGVGDEWELCQTCGDERRERGSWCRKRGFEEMHQYEQ